MKIRWWGIVSLGLILSGAFDAKSAEPMVVDAASLNPSATSVYGQACEKIRQDEQKSSVRFRATDKAAFEAVKNISELREYQSKFNEHDFNVLIYNVVDNYVEDLAVRTTKQSEQEICVEVTGYVVKNDVTSAVEELLLQRPDNNSNELKEDEKQLDPEEVMKKASMSHSPQEQKETSVPQVDPKLKPLYQPEPMPQELSSATVEQSQETTPVDKTRSLVYVAPTEFFNNTNSESHAQILKDFFGKSSEFYLTPQQNLADYIITSKVLRAKVDPINKNTNRLQMVVSVGVEIVDSGASSIEHQNRFILFSSQEDEQTVAGDLMRKLLLKAAEPILNKTENDAGKKAGSSTLPKIITPRQ